MNKRGWILLVPVAVAVLYSAYAYRKAPLPVAVAIVPFAALAWLVLHANPAKPNSWKIRFFTWIGLYPLIQRLNAMTAGWHMLARAGVILATILWFIFVLQHWPAAWPTAPLVK